MPSNYVSFRGALINADSPHIISFISQDHAVTQGEQTQTEHKIVATGPGGVSVFAAVYPNKAARDAFMENLRRELTSKEVSGEEKTQESNS